MNSGLCMNNSGSPSSLGVRPESLSPSVSIQTNFPGTDEFPPHLGIRLRPGYLKTHTRPGHGAVSSNQPSLNSVIMHAASGGGSCGSRTTESERRTIDEAKIAFLAPPQPPPALGIGSRRAGRSLDPTFTEQTRRQRGSKGKPLGAEVPARPVARGGSRLQRHTEEEAETPRQTDLPRDGGAARVGETRVSGAEST